MRTLGDSLVTTIVDLQQKSNDFSIVPIIYKGDWYEISEPVVYTSASVITVSNTLVDLTKLFAKGDPLRLKQGGAYKYFYVYAITTNTISIIGGTDYTLTNATITDLAKGLKLNAIGFPVYFNYNANPRGAGSSVLSGMSATSYKFWMTGPVCSLDLHFDLASMTNGPNSSIFMSTPIQAANLGNGTPIFSIVVVNNFNLQTGIAKLNSSNTDIEVQIMEYPGTGGFGFWQTSTNGHYVDISFAYLIQV